MQRSLIYLLENYMGWILCRFLDLHYTISSALFKQKNANTPTQKIIFLKLIEQGALVLHLPSFHKAIAEYGKENVFICSFSSNQSLLIALDVFKPDNIILINERSLHQFARGVIRLVQFTRKKQIDTILDLEFFSKASAILCYLTGAGKRVGFHRFQGSETYRGNLFTHRMIYSPYLSVRESGLLLLHSCSKHTEELPGMMQFGHSTITTPLYKSSDAENSTIQKLFIDNGYDSKYKIIINPNLNDPLPLRKWPEEHYARFIYQLRNTFPESVFVFTGREDEYKDTESFFVKYKISDALNLCGKTTLGELLSLYHYCDMLLTSDSGPGHFAVLSSIPTLVLFGPETPTLYGPQSDNIHILYQKTPCSPCFNVYNNRISSCKNNICMKLLMPEQVTQEAVNILSSRKRKLTQIVTAFEP